MMVPESDAGKAYKILERLVVTLELAPGRQMTEGALIRCVGLGRTPVREAIQRLAWQGFLHVHPRAGLSVAPLERADWLKVIEARHGAEIVLARSAARFASENLLSQFRDAALWMEDAVLSGSVIAFLDADKLLDEALAAAAENPYAARLVAPLQTHSRRFWFRYQSTNGLPRVAEQHVRLIRAFLNRDEEEAAREADALMQLLRKFAEAVR
ncbi:GntR family transcriptional regulator [Chelativorans sp. Marseille-P2723]|uniref:GntR family transcriptional regulator n=1 Tax=Chelativorans sp. Marseille-P2723 TaxID=2709133 RepID=UPI001570C096|nr:GntR family transcriptional regulator [Chelativorans sp. Marseille-P2723]